MPPKTYDVAITFRSASNLPIADLGTLASDPYAAATLTTPVSIRDPEKSPPLHFRTPTVRTTTNPVWECRWDLSNVPREGTKLHINVLDEDVRNHDDRLGQAVIDFQALESWGPGQVNEGSYKLRKKGASKKAAVLKLCAADIKRKKRVTAMIVVRIEVKRETRLPEGFRDINRAFTHGPNYWSKHFSPLIGKVVRAKDSPQEQDKATTFSFEANKIQLTGPTPPELCHRYVDFAPFVTAYFSRKGLKGRVLNRALHSQYNHLYCHDQNTEYGYIDNSPEGRKEDSNALAKRFLEMAHWSEGHRIFTYIITLDAEWHFTETGDEFAVDLLSKHSLHSDVSKYIAYSGEFFIRKRHGHSHHHHHHHDRHHHGGEADAITPPNTDPQPTDHDPSHYELIIDNDSGTYRPKEELLPQLQRFLDSNLTGIGAVTTYHCFNDELERLKKERKDAKNGGSGGHRVFRQRSISSTGSSISSSDEEELDTGREGNVVKRRWAKWMMSGSGAAPAGPRDGGGASR
ncbi:C2 domain-containing protein [Morchella snyderi]|nr:C2 domain-containing protein [Morchella snyderi]